MNNMNLKYEKIIALNSRDYLALYMWGVSLACYAALCVQLGDTTLATKYFNMSYSKFGEASSIQPNWSPILGSWGLALRLHAGFKQVLHNDTQVLLNLKCN